MPGIGPLSFRIRGFAHGANFPEALDEASWHAIESSEDERRLSH